MVVDRKLGELGSEPIPRLQPRIGPSDPLRAVLIARKRAKLLQLGNRALRIYFDSHWVLEIGRLSPQQLTAPTLSDELAVAHLHLAAHSNHMRTPLNGKAFKAAVVTV